MSWKNLCMSASPTWGIWIGRTGEGGGTDCCREGEYAPGVGDMGCFGGGMNRAPTEVGAFGFSSDCGVGSWS